MGNKEMTYEMNYGYINNYIAFDNAEVDVLVLDVKEPIE
jgi:inorganic pyrophosphatase